MRKVPNITASALPLALLALGATEAHAQAGYVEAIPTAWRLQDYNDGKINLFFTGSPCPNGRLELLASVPDGSKAQLWSTIMTGKITHELVGVYYHVDDGHCLIDTFYLKETS